MKRSRIRWIDRRTGMLRKNKKRICNIKKTSRAIYTAGSHLRAGNISSINIFIVVFQSCPLKVCASLFLPPCVCASTTRANVFRDWKFHGTRLVWLVNFPTAVYKVTWECKRYRNTGVACSTCSIDALLSLSPFQLI